MIECQLLVVSTTCRANPGADRWRRELSKPASQNILSAACLPGAVDEFWLHLFQGIADEDALCHLRAEPAMTLPAMPAVTTTTVAQPAAPTAASSGPVYQASDLHQFCSLRRMGLYQHPLWCLFKTWFNVADDLKSRRHRVIFVL